MAQLWCEVVGTLESLGSFKRKEGFGREKLEKGKVQYKFGFIE
jgi:hypothetical protein